MLRFILPTLLWLSFPVGSYAGWFTDAALYTEHVVGSVYRVKAVFYVPCGESIPPTDSVQFCVKNPCANTTLNSKRTFIFLSGNNISEQPRYEASMNVDLGAPCAEWTISATVSTYKPTVNMMSFNEPLYLEAKVNTLNFTNSAQPRFQFLYTNWKIAPHLLSSIFLTPLRGDLNDSLYSELVMPQKSSHNCGSPSPLSFSSSAYNLQQYPIALDSPIKVTQPYGNMFLQAANAAIGYNLITLKTSQYRGGVFVGSAMRTTCFEVKSMGSISAPITLISNSFAGATLSAPNADTIYANRNMPFSFWVKTKAANGNNAPHLSLSLSPTNLIVGQQDVVRQGDSLITQFILNVPSATPSLSTISITSTDTLIDCYGVVVGLNRTYRQVALMLDALKVEAAPLSPTTLIYPNPATEKLFISNARFYTARVFNSHGQEVYAESHASQINVSSWPKGVYLLTLYNSHGAVVKREKLLVE